MRFWGMKEGKMLSNREGSDGGEKRKGEGQRGGDEENV